MESLISGFSEILQEEEEEEEERERERERKREREKEREKNEKEKKKKKKTGVIRDCVNLLSGIIIHEQQPGRGDGKRRRNVQSPLL